jgi:hypothetical protein
MGQEASRLVSCPLCARLGDPAAELQICELRESGILVFKLGEATLPEDLYEVAVYLFDTQNDDGVFWDNIEMSVRDGDA